MAGLTAETTIQVSDVVLNREPLHVRYKGRVFMHFGILLLFANAGSSLSDEELWKAEMDLGEYAEELGFNSVWAPEHHFDRPYCTSPDPLQALTYLSARTSRIELGTAAIILPWHQDPIRLAERLSIVDALPDGRLQVGIG